MGLPSPSTPSLGPASPIRCLGLWTAFPEPHPAKCSVPSESYHVKNFKSPSLHPWWSSSYQNKWPHSSPLHVSVPLAFYLEVPVSEEAMSISPLPESKLSHMTYSGLLLLSRNTGAFRLLRGGELERASLMQTNDFSSIRLRTEFAKTTRHNPGGGRCLQGASSRAQSACLGEIVPPNTTQASKRIQLENVNELLKASLRM